MTDLTRAQKRDLDEVADLAATAAESLVQRDRKIVKLYRAKVSPTLIAQHASVSRVRVHQIAAKAAPAKTSAKTEESE